MIDSQLHKWEKKLAADATQKHITEAIRGKLNQEASVSTNNIKCKVLKLFPICCTNFTPHNIIHSRQMSSKLDEIATKLDDLGDMRSKLGLIVNSQKSNIRESLQEETSLVDESKIMGREGDEVALLDHSWVCVSEELDVYNISKAIFQAVTWEDKDFANLDLLHVALEEKLSKMRFLLVLDDVWNEDHSKWELLQSPLLVGHLEVELLSQLEYQGRISDGLKRILWSGRFVK